MSFTFDNALADDVSLVRFHIGDGNEDGYFLDDETIQYWVDDSSVNEAVITCIVHIISQLSTPNFRLDWMRVDNDSARKGYERLLTLKKQELGVTWGAYGESVITYPSRADSYQSDDDSPPEYDGAP